jgi:hypothetical protein
MMLDMAVTNSPHVTRHRLMMERNIGAPVRKVFFINDEGGDVDDYEGKVHSITTNNKYLIIYTDGDSEDMSHREFLKHNPCEPLGGVSSVVQSFLKFFPITGHLTSSGTPCLCFSDPPVVFNLMLCSATKFRFFFPSPHANNRYCSNKHTREQLCNRSCSNKTHTHV